MRRGPLEWIWSQRLLVPCEEFGEEVPHSYPASRSLISAAGLGSPRAVVAVAATGYLGLLTGPAALGASASLSSLSVALVVPVWLAAVVALCAHRAFGTLSDRTPAHAPRLDALILGYNGVIGLHPTQRMRSQPGWHVL